MYNQSRPPGFPSRSKFAIRTQTNALASKLVRDDSDCDDPVVTF
jgi:hypothetical protein